MKAAKALIDDLSKHDLIGSLARIEVQLFGSLALTCVGHGTDKAIINGLAGAAPESIDPKQAMALLASFKENNILTLQQGKTLPFNFDNDLVLLKSQTLQEHSNALKFFAYDNEKKCVYSNTYFSVRGGFIVTEKEFGLDTPDKEPVPYYFGTAEDLLNLCIQHKLSISDIMLANEKTWKDESNVKQSLLDIAKAMEDSINKGCHSEGILPGGLHVKRRATELYQKIKTQGIQSIHENADIMNYLNLYAMAVNEENAAGGRIVTAPTNGAAGIIPAVMMYLKYHHENNKDEDIINYLLTAGAIAILYKKRASISGAEVGCQGEVGVASSMAAAGLTAVRLYWGDYRPNRDAAEIAMEHHLGMTCDPIGGLVQIPCIERNAMGSVKAVNAACLALMEEGQNKVSLDKVISTMRQTGHDMMTIYKETSEGGLAVNVPEC